MRQHTKVCLICEEEYLCQRSDSKTCSSKCRRALSRRTDSTWLVNKECWLYEIYNQRGEFLYVGVTTLPYKRLLEHKLLRPWWSDASTITWQRMPDRDTALRIETDLILNKNPIYNIRVK